MRKCENDNGGLIGVELLSALLKMGKRRYPPLPPWFLRVAPVAFISPRHPRVIVVLDVRRLLYLSVYTCR